MTRIFFLKLVHKHTRSCTPFRYPVFFLSIVGRYSRKFAFDNDIGCKKCKYSTTKSVEKLTDKMCGFGSGCVSLEQICMVLQWYNAQQWSSIFYHVCRCQNLRYRLKSMRKVSKYAPLFFQSSLF